MSKQKNLSKTFSIPQPYHPDDLIKELTKELVNAKGIIKHRDEEIKQLKSILKATQAYLSQLNDMIKPFIKKNKF